MITIAVTGGCSQSGLWLFTNYTGKRTGICKPHTVSTAVDTTIDFHIYISHVHIGQELI